MKLKTSVLEEMTGKLSEMKQQVQIMVRPSFFFRFFFLFSFLFLLCFWFNIVKDKNCGNRFCLIVMYMYVILYFVCDCVSGACERKKQCVVVLFFTV